VCVCVCVGYAFVYMCVIGGACVYVCVVGYEQQSDDKETCYHYHGDTIHNRDSMVPEHSAVAMEIHTIGIPGRQLVKEHYH